VLSASASSCILKNDEHKVSALSSLKVKKTRVKFTTEDMIVEWEEGTCFWISLENDHDMALTKVIPMIEDEIEDLHHLAVVGPLRDENIAESLLLELDMTIETFTEEMLKGENQLVSLTTHKGLNEGTHMFAK